MPLPLYGVARIERSAVKDNRRQALRVRAPTCVPTEEDVALVRSSADIEVAATSGFAQIMAIGDDKQFVTDASAFLTVYSVAERFDYCGRR